MSRHTTFEEFTNSCANQAIEIDPQLIGAPYVSSCCYQPDTWYQAVAAAGQILRKDPDRELTNAPIPAELTGSSSSADIAQLALVGILNASRDRIVGTNPGTTFFCRNAKRVDNCSQAEGGFTYTLRAMSRGPDYFNSHGQGWSILVDGDRAIGLTKMYGERSTLSLAPYAINGIPYPPGSLFRVDTSQYVREGERRRLAIPSEMVAFCGFLRLSAFALPVQRRNEFEDAIYYTPKADANIIRHWSIRQIQNVVQRAIQHSEVVA